MSHILRVNDDMVCNTALCTFLCNTTGTLFYLTKNICQSQSFCPAVVQKVAHPRACAEVEAESEQDSWSG